MHQSRCLSTASASTLLSSLWPLQGWWRELLSNHTHVLIIATSSSNCQNSVSLFFTHPLFLMTRPPPSCSLAFSLSLPHSAMISVCSSAVSQRWRLVVPVVLLYFPQYIVSGFVPALFACLSSCLADYLISMFIQSSLSTGPSAICCLPNKNINYSVVMRDCWHIYIHS